MAKNSVHMQPTGIAAFDDMLRGGIPSGSTILLAGNSGTGKTVLSMQWLFAGHKEYGEKGIYVSLTEPVGRLMQNVATFSFYEQAATDAETGDIQFWDLRSILEQMNLSEKDWTEEDIWKVVEAIGNLVVKSGAKRVVLDSVTALCYRLEKQHLIRQFIFSLGTTLSYLDATVLLISEVTGDAVSIYGVEEFISDGIIKLWYTNDRHTTRYMRILKMRGTAFNDNMASYDISANGITLYPRTDLPAAQEATLERIPTGVRGLDIMTTGGFIRGSSVFVSGASGCGKSTLSTQFTWSCLEEGNKSIYISFEETPSQVMRNAAVYGWDLESHQKSGLLAIRAETAESMSLQAHFSDIQALAEQEGIKSLVIDSLSALSHVFSTEQVYDFCRQLIALARSRSITIVCTAASNNLIGTDAISDIQLSTFFDQIIMLRYIEIESELKKGLVILKMRGSDHDRRMREITFGEHGLSVAADFSDYEGVMSGNVRRVTRSMEDHLHSVFLEFLGSRGEKYFSEQKKQGITLESLQTLIRQLVEDGLLPKERLADFMDRVEKLME